MNYISKLEVRKILDNELPPCLIMTTDGIHEYVDIDTFEELMLSEKDDLKIAEEIVNIALKNGSLDDKTIVIIRN